MFKREFISPTSCPGFTKPAPCLLCSGLANSIHIHISKAKSRGHSQTRPFLPLHMPVSKPSELSFRNKSLSSTLPHHPQGCGSSSHPFSAKPLIYLFSVLHVSSGYVLKKQSNKIGSCLGIPVDDPLPIELRKISLMGAQNTLHNPIPSFIFSL